ncbi:MAG TPA: nuclear transport factor 2 family protein [Vicinamibacteria bacterium]|nr:nuclear transport factor 2 family protein [Vicinamibacteria bacterium]
MDALFIVTFQTGPAWTPGKPPAEQPAFAEHGANLQRLRREGVIAVGARYADKGMIVARFPDEAAARREIAADPGIKAGTFTYELAELRPFFAGCLEAPPRAAPAAGFHHPSVPLPAPLARVLTDYERAWQAKDAAGLAALFAEDGYVLAGGKPPVHGRGAIERHYAGHGGALSLRALAFATEGPVGWVIGAYGPAKGEPDDGKFTLTLRKDEDGRWLIVSDMDNGNARR